MTEAEIRTLFDTQKTYFLTNATKDVQMRILTLRTLRSRIETMEAELCEALRLDLGKSKNEAWMMEISMLYKEIDDMIVMLPLLAKRKGASSPIWMQPGRSFVMQEPYGVVLIVSPWNYPVQLTLNPLIGAIAAGNCAIVKPSAYSPHVSAVIKKLLSYYPGHYIATVEGGREENQYLLQMPFNFIFFTGSQTVGKLVLHAAAENLTPCLLELGGKSPVIVTEDANITVTAKRILFGKLLNAGQTCVAPDYVLVDEKVHDALIEALQKTLPVFCPKPLENADYPHIINDKHFARLTGLMQGERVTGGQYDAASRKIALTVIDHATKEHPAMQEEIFGPILPVLTYKTLDEAIAFVNERSSPLALYLFASSEQVQNKVLNSIRFGGGCINDCLLHVANPNIPFGGVGASGMGGYHGEDSFYTFSHGKSIVKRGTNMDMAMRYMPYTPSKMKLIRKMM